MKRLFAATTALGILAAPTASLADTASIRLSLTVPIQCTLDVISGEIRDNTVFLQVHRNCNTGHEIVLSGLEDPTLGKISVSFNGHDELAAAGNISLVQAEGY